jgi:DNA-binding IclR family transcriptional regulator
MAEWSFLTNHARALVCIAHDPGVRLRDIAAALHITERSAYGIVSELAAAGYVVKERDGRRNRYEIQGHLPLRGAVGRERTIGEVLDVLVEARAPADADSANQPFDASRTQPARARWRWSAQTAQRN